MSCEAGHLLLGAGALALLLGAGALALLALLAKQQPLETRARLPGCLVFGLVLQTDGWLRLHVRCFHQQKGLSFLQPRRRTGPVMAPHDTLPRTDPCFPAYDWCTLECTSTAPFHGADNAGFVNAGLTTRATVQPCIILPRFPQLPSSSHGKNDCCIGMEPHRHS